MDEGANVGIDGDPSGSGGDGGTSTGTSKPATKPGKSNGPSNSANADAGAEIEEDGDNASGGRGGTNGKSTAGAGDAAAGSSSDRMSGDMDDPSAGTKGAAGSKAPEPPMCGNEKVESGETCDGNCPTEQDCPAPDPCLEPAVDGDAASCTAECSTTPITKCAASDACCPEGCNSVNDSDCSPSCGNSTMEDGETCDPPASCPTSCDDGDPCTTDVKTGSSAQCNIQCSHMPVKSPKNGDGCCPNGANANNDSDCSEECGNGVVEDGETCDPAGSCPASCDDGDPCTMDPMTGSASSCTAECGPKVRVGAKTTSDKCCPGNASLSDDPDCPAPSGWTAVEPGSCSGSSALKLHSGASVDCSASPCKCSAPPNSNCRGGIAGTTGEVWITATSCGEQVAPGTGTGNIEVAGLFTMPDTGGCGITGNGVGKVSFSGQVTYCPVSTPRTTSCLTRAGDVACPAGYDSRKGLYKSYRGGGCTCTGCGVATQPKCESWGVAQQGCSGPKETRKPLDALIGVDLAVLRVWVNETPGTCNAAKPQALDDITLSEPQTVCCP